MSRIPEMIVMLKCDGCGRKSLDGKNWRHWIEDGKEKHNCQRCQRHAVDMHEIGPG